MDYDPEPPVEDAQQQESLDSTNRPPVQYSDRRAGYASASAIPLPRSASTSLSQLQYREPSIELVNLEQAIDSQDAAQDTALPSSAPPSEISSTLSHVGVTPRAVALNYVPSQSELSVSLSDTRAQDATSRHRRIAADSWAGNATPGSSLRQLETSSARFEEDPSQADDNVSAASVPLPDSHSGSSQQTQSVLNSERQHLGIDRAQEASGAGRNASYESLASTPPRSESGVRYRDWIRHDYSSTPELEVVLSNYCRAPHGGRVYYYDYLEDIRVPAARRSFKSSTAWGSEEASKKFTALREVTDLNVICRVVLVEDLTPSLIDALGNTFDIPPGAFAEHLNQSGYSWDSYEHEPPSKWHDAYLSKAHASLRWFRPVRQEKTVTGWLKHPEIFLKTEYTATDDVWRPPEAISFSGIQGAITWIDTQYQELRKSFIESRIHHNIHATTNIFRQCWPLSMRNNESDTNQIPVSLDKQRFSELIPVAWEEKATVLFDYNAAVPIMIFLLDPLPTMTDTQEIIETTFQGPIVQAVHSEESTNNQDVDMYRPIYPRTLRGAPGSDSFQRVLRTVKSVRSMMLNDDIRQLDPSGLRTDPVLALIKVAHVDTKALLECLEWLLDEISRDSLDDYLMNKSLQDWRRIMNDFSSALPAVGNSLQAFVNFIYGDDPPDDVSEIVRDLDIRLERSIGKLKEAHNALRSDLAIMESRRSIAEAETVTKLTELAFAFIPLTFASSLYSMQLVELSGGVHVGTFIATAILVATFCYGTRIIIRSSAIAESKRRALETFWATGKLRPGSKIPTRKLIQLTGQELWKSGESIIGILIFIFMITLVVLPIVFMWTTTKLDSSWSVMMTLVLLPCGGMVAWVWTSNFMSTSHYARLPLSFRAAMWFSHLKLRRRKDRRTTSEESIDSA